MQAVITVVGSDKVGILAGVSGVCAAQNINVEEVSQTILRGTFAMIMLVSVPEKTDSFEKLRNALNICGEENGVQINITRQEIFDAMHRV